MYNYSSTENNDFQEPGEDGDSMLLELTDSDVKSSEQNTGRI